MEPLSQEIIAGRRLTPLDDFSYLFHGNLEELLEGANDIRKHFCGSSANLCTIVNGRSGRCSEDCKFCAQSSHYPTDATTYPFLPCQDILEDCQHNQAMGVHRYAIVTAGRSINGQDFTQALETYRTLSSQSSLALCASHGLQTLAEFKQLKEAGVGRYHANLETSQGYFPKICTTHTYEDKVENIRLARLAGLEVCSGGIIGMGESWQDRVDMALALYELGITSIPLNILRPIPGTPFGHLEVISKEDILRTVALFRYCNPTAEIRMAAGRNLFEDGGTALFQGGANATITGDMLTTTGTDIQFDQEMLKTLGFTLSQGDIHHAEK